MQQISGQITVALAGTAVAGPDIGPGEFVLQPGKGNGGIAVYIGNDGTGDVSSATGLSLADGQQVTVAVRTLASVYFDAAKSGDKIEWLFKTRYAGSNYGLVVDFG